MEILQMKENLPTVWRIPNDEWNFRHVEVMQRMYRAGQNPIKFDSHPDFVEVTCEYTAVIEESAWESFLSDVYTDVVEAIEGGDHTTEELMEIRETEFGNRKRKSVLSAIDEKLQPEEPPEEEEPEEPPEPEEAD